jgi:hypothetical protein
LKIESRQKRKNCRFRKQLGYIHKLSKSDNLKEQQTSCILPINFQRRAKEIKYKVMAKPLLTDADEFFDTK